MALREADEPVRSDGAQEAGVTTAADPTRPLGSATAEAVAVTEQPDPPPHRRGLGVAAWLSIAWFVTILVAAVASPILPIADPFESDFLLVADPPSLAHPLGTDGLGRDLLARVILGGRVSLAVGVIAVVLGMTVGGLLGLIAGYVRGTTESLITSLADAMLAFPALVLLLGITAVLGQNLRNLIIGLAIVTVPAFIRLTRANTLRVASEEYVVAARASGARRRRILLQEVMPNVLPPTGAYAFVIMAVVIVAEGSLSFLGLGVPPPTPSWGGMISDGRAALQESPHIVAVPALVMFITVFCFNVVGDRLRQLFDVREGAL